MTQYLVALNVIFPLPGLQGIPLGDCSHGNKPRVFYVHLHIKGVYFVICFLYGKFQDIAEKFYPQLVVNKSSRLSLICHVS